MQRVRVSYQQTPVQKLGDAQISLSPKFRVGAAASLPITSSDSFGLEEPDLRSHMDTLIPGLPDDVALNCLLRLPVSSLPACRSVCRRWRHTLPNKEAYFTVRRTLGLQGPWLFVLAADRCTGKMQWQVFDPVRRAWHAIPAMPCPDRLCPQGLGCAALPNQSAIVVSGGAIHDTHSSVDHVLRFDMHRNRWTIMSRMSTPRSSFGCGVIDGVVYAAGGSSGDLLELDSVEALDPGKGTWQFVAKMEAGMSVYDSAVIDGKLLVTEGWTSPFVFSPRGQVYDPRSNTSGAMHPALREGWTGPSAVLHGQLFVVSDREEMRLKTFDESSESWRTVAGSPVPDCICRPFTVCSAGDTMYIVGRELQVVIGDVRRSRFDAGGEGNCSGFSVWWQCVDAPRAFSELTPSLCGVVFG